MCGQQPIHLNPMKHEVATLFCILLVWMSQGCKPKQEVISGQMFVVTEAAINLPLGDVEIFLIDRAQVSQFLDQKQRSTETAIRALAEDAKSQATRIDLLSEQRAHIQQDNALFYTKLTSYAEYAEINQKRDAAVRSLSLLQRNATMLEETNSLLRNLAFTSTTNTARNDFLRLRVEFNRLDYQSAKLFEPEMLSVKQNNANLAKPDSEPNEIKAWRNFLTYASNRLAVIHEQSTKAESSKTACESDLRAIEENMRAENTKRLKAVEASLASSSNRLDALKVRARDLMTAEAYLGDFPRTNARKIRTDAEGRFRIPLTTPGSFSVFAQARRKTFEGEERYFWLVDAPTRQGDEFLLSNSRTVDHDPNGYLKAHGLPLRWQKAGDFTIHVTGEGN
jgi:hypothetical protein